MERLRTVRFTPYSKGKGPVFALTIYYNGTEHTPYKLTSNGDIIFQGSDFRCSPLHGIESDEAIKSLMGFLTCSLGDTDSDYFKDYTEKQLDFCRDHAEALAHEVYCRFGD